MSRYYETVGIMGQDPSEINNTSLLYMENVTCVFFGRRFRELRKDAILVGVIGADAISAVY